MEFPLRPGPRGSESRGSFFEEARLGRRPTLPEDAGCGCGQGKLNSWPSSFGSDEASVPLFDARTGDANAIYALGVVGGPAAAEVLRKSLASPEAMRKRLLWAGEPDNGQQITSYEVLKLAQAIGRVGLPETGWLETAVASGDPHLASVAVKVLARIRPEGLDRLALDRLSREAPDSPLRMALLHHLLQGGGAETMW